MAHGAVNPIDMYANNRYPTPGGDGMAMMANLTAASSVRKRPQAESLIVDEDDEEMEQMISRKKEDSQEVISQMLAADDEKPKEDETDRSNPENCDHETQWVFL